MKVVYVTGESYIDHSHTIVSLLRLKVDLKVFFQAKSLTEENENWCKNFDAVFVKRKRLRNPLSFWKEYNFIRMLKKINAECVWFNTLTFYQVIWAKLFLRNFLVNMHDVEVHPQGNDFYTVISQKLTLLLLKKHITVVSKTQADLFKSKYNFKPSVFQLPIIDYYRKQANSPSTSLVASRQIEDPAVSEGRGGGETGISFFFFGSILPYKGLETLLEACTLLQQGNFNFKLNIFGKLKYKPEKLPVTISENPNIKHFDSYIDFRKVSAVFLENDVLILPYKQVTQCGPLLIAYNFGIPVICNDLPGFKEYVDDELSGLLYSSSPESLAEKMKSVSHSKISEMKKYIQTDISNKFSMDALTTQYLNNLKKAVN